MMLSFVWRTHRSQNDNVASSAHQHRHQVRSRVTLPVGKDHADDFVSRSMPEHRQSWCVASGTNQGIALSEVLATCELSASLRKIAVSDLEPSKLFITICSELFYEMLARTSYSAYDTLTSTKSCFDRAQISHTASACDSEALAVFAFCVVALYARRSDVLALELWLKHHDPTLARCTHDNSRRFTGCTNQLRCYHC